MINKFTKISNIKTKKENEIIKILNYNSEFCENQAGVKGKVVWGEDFEEVAKEILQKLKDNEKM